MLVICLNEPVMDMRRPPNDAYAVLGTSGTGGKHNASAETISKAYTISAEPPSNLYTFGAV